LNIPLVVAKDYFFLAIKSQTAIAMVATMLSELIGEEFVFISIGLVRKTC
jgi:hypothetical protein